MAIAILLCAFSFSGNNNSLTVFKNVKAQAELVSATKTAQGKRAVEFKKFSFAFEHHDHAIFPDRQHWQTILQTYDNRLKAKFDNIAKRRNSINKVDKFVHIANIPSGSDKDNPALIG